MKIEKDKLINIYELTKAYEYKLEEVCRAYGTFCYAEHVTCEKTDEREREKRFKAILILDLLGQLDGMKMHREDIPADYWEYIECRNETCYDYLPIEDEDETVHQKLIRVASEVSKYLYGLKA